MQDNPGLTVKRIGMIGVGGRMKTLMTRPVVCGLAVVAMSAGCASIERGKASEVHVGFGFPMIFDVQKDETGIAKTAGGTVKAADSRTKFTILGFWWESRAKDAELKLSPVATGGAAGVSKP
jgi:hypothetical protein